MGLDVESAARAQGILEDRVDVDGHAEPVARFGPGAAGMGQPDPLGFAARRDIPVELDPRLGGAAQGVDVVGTAEDRDASLTRRDPPRHMVHHAQRNLAPDGGQELPLGLRPDRLGPGSRRIGATPANDVDDADRVRLLQQPGAGTRGLCRIPRRLRQHREGREDFGRFDIPLDELGGSYEDGSLSVVQGKPPQREAEDSRGTDPRQETGVSKPESENGKRPVSGIRPARSARPARPAKGLAASV